MAIEPITFIDKESGVDAFVLVRVVGLVLSLRTNGEIEAFMEAEELDRVIAALQAARAELRAAM
ncbi:hypothetical protein ACQR1I_27985 [Bradyrhizobium sp. HKCCYLS2038]|uniref:hypothetical protein n=1 Tax=unclassified Bradyrhizobium TaxID=2631580 RepID=UPI003EBA7B32